MKLEQQVCSLELAKRLQELGIKQDSLFWWLDGERPELRYLYNFTGQEKKKYSAYNVAELGEILPDNYFTRKHFGSGTKRWHWQVYHGYEETSVNGELIASDMYTSDTEADARAKMLVYLLENNLLTTYE